MNPIDDLAGRVRVISTEVQNNIRASLHRAGLAGWGQFIDAAAHAHQIGPYGTCAGLLAISIGQPGAATDPRAVAQISDFWSSGAGSKLYEQNVRLAFLVLCLARIQEPTLAAVRDAVSQELRARQLQDGSWGDWRDSNGIPPSGRPDTTAWVVLGLSRLNPADAAAMSGAEYLARHAAGNGQLRTLSPIAIAAALSVLPRDKQPSELKRRARKLVDSMRVDEEEHISFFDYLRPIPGSIRMDRDYLCFPAFYPLSLIISGLLSHSHILEMPRLAVSRIYTIEGLTDMIGTSRFYRLPGARFAATVDQAMVALTYEQLEANPTSIDSTVVLLRPIWLRISNSIIVRVYLPLIVIACAIATLQSPKVVPEAIQQLTGVQLDGLITFIEDHTSVIQLAVATLLAVFPQLPGSVLAFIRRRWRL